MNLVFFAPRRPISVLVLVMAAVAAGLFAVSRMPRNVFPDLGVPVLYVAQPYGGMFRPGGWAASHCRPRSRHCVLKSAGSGDAATGIIAGRPRGS